MMKTRANSSFHSRTGPKAPRRNSEDHRWAIVLAGGAGERMQAFIRARFGRELPKQYCAFVGRRSMLQHTLDRTRQLVRPSRMVTVIGRGHQKFLSTRYRTPGQVIEQPANRDTAAGLFLPLTWILARDPQATVLVFPSDHFVFPEESFLAQAAKLAEKLKDRLILLGVPVKTPEADYGWIETAPDPQAGHGHRQEMIREVLAFHEKPSAGEARRFSRRGCLCNTMIMTVRARTLWDLGHRLLPDLMSRFERLLRVMEAVQAGRVDAGHERLALPHIYHDLPPANFSRDILQRAVATTLVFPLANLDWSDWGRPARVVESLARLKKSPAGFGHPQTMAV